jgi:hypothetical protein
VEAPGAALDSPVYTSTSPYVLMEWRLIKRSGNFIFTLPDHDQNGE